MENPQHLLQIHGRGDRMKERKAIQILATRVGQLEADKALLLAQLDELNGLVHELQKEVEQFGTRRTNETTD